MSHLTIELQETSSSLLVTGATMLNARPSPSLERFFSGSQALELLLSLLEDDEPVPEIFESLATFLSLSHPAPHHLLAFSLRILFLLGVLPEATEPGIFQELSEEEQAFLNHSIHGHFAAVDLRSALERLPMLCHTLLREHATRPLRAADVTAACR